MSKWKKGSSLRTVYIFGLTLKCLFLYYYLQFLLIWNGLVKERVFGINIGSKIIIFNNKLVFSIST